MVSMVQELSNPHPTIKRERKLERTTRGIGPVDRDPCFEKQFPFMIADFLFFYFLDMKSSNKVIF